MYGNDTSAAAPHLANVTMASTVTDAGAAPGINGGKICKL